MKYKIIKSVLLTTIVILLGVLFFYYQDIYTVTFDTKGGTIYESVNVKPNGLVIQPEDPVLPGYVFNGWYIGSTDKKFDFNSKIHESITLTAKWISIT